MEALCSGFCTARLGLNTRISLVQKYGLFCFGPEADAQVGADTRSYLSSGMSRYTSTGTVGRLLGWMGRLRGVGDRNYMSVWVNVGADQDYSELTLLALRAVAAGAATLSRPAAGRTRLTRRY